MAKQLYDYWFVQFDFPNEDGKPYKSSGGKMVWNEKLKREIPKGWTNARLIDIANITMGQSPAGVSYNNEGKGIVFYQGCTDFGDRFPNVRQYTTEPSRFACKGDILMSVRAPVGSLNIANTDCCIGRGLATLRSKIKSNTHLYFVLSDYKSFFHQCNSSGTTFGSITREDLFNLPIILPTNEVISAFEVINTQIFEKQMVNDNTIKLLTKLRDELLPLLMNDQVSINYDFSLKLYDAICFSVILKKEILHERIINQFNS
ncbi:MAG: restriction endonuclease subunit S [Muribaculaceae bacterium]|jgi:type I restriction enzyme S subunit|nr:restriction endonuclease subunit S [Muribaculaceae bacterium]